MYEVDEFAKELIHRFGMEILPIEGGLFVLMLIFGFIMIKLDIQILLPDLIIYNFSRRPDLPFRCDMADPYRHYPGYKVFFPG